MVTNSRYKLIGGEKVQCILKNTEQAIFRSKKYINKYLSKSIYLPIYLYLSLYIYRFVFSFEVRDKESEHGAMRGGGGEVGGGGGKKGMGLMIVLCLKGECPHLEGKSKFTVL